MFRIILIELCIVFVNIRYAIESDKLKDIFTPKFIWSLYILYALLYLESTWRGYM